MKPLPIKTWPVLLLFFCSGATALVYEVIWSKFLSQMFGSTIYAQTVVLAVFMGGLALGNNIFGSRADRLARPIRVYAIVEICIGLYAALFTNFYALADKAFVQLGAQILDNGLMLLGLKGLLSVGLLLGPTILMGGTLPLMAAFLQRSSLDANRISARFYSVNSLGAVVGAAMAGFYLVQTYGMNASLQIGALANVMIGAGAFFLSRTADQNETEKAPNPSQSGLEKPAPNCFCRSTLLVSLTGCISMGLEILAARSMSLLFGSSLQSFSIVLISFILGIGLGSALVSSPRIKHLNSVKMSAILLIAAALWIGFLVWNIESWVEVYRVLRSGLNRSTTGYIFYQLLATVLSMGVLGVPAALIGGVLPLLLRTSTTGNALAAHVGRLLTWNTVGAVAGVLLTGFLLMPKFGLRNAFLFLAAGLAAAAFIAVLDRHLRNYSYAAGAAGLLLLALMTIGDDSWKHVMSSGVFRAREDEVDSTVMALRKAHVKIHLYEDAPDATVTIEQGDGIGAPADLGLRLNGKADASNKGDLCTQLLLGHVPMAACPGAKDVFILGLGSGITGGAILGHPIERLTIAENCEPVIRAARYFNPWNRGVLTSSRTKILCEDARTVLKLSPQKYDVIITQPSNPWMAGVGSVFSREYYELAAKRLKEGGVVAQWFHVYDMHDGILSLVLRTFQTVFPNVEIWDSGSGDLILLGALKPWRSDASVFAGIFDRPEVRKDLEGIGITCADALWARQLSSQQTAFAIAGDGPIQSDLFPILEYEAPRAFYIGAQAKMLIRFDERTWQAELAPQEKQNALQSITARDLQPIFSENSTINPELKAHLQWRFHGGIGTAPEFRSWWPCLFKTNTTSSIPNIPSDAGDELRQLLTAAKAIENRGADALSGIETIANLLRNHGPQSGWSPGHYAKLAAKASIGLGKPQQATEILALAIRMQPGDSELNYLQRIAQKQQVMLTAGKPPATLMSSARTK